MLLRQETKTDFNNVHIGPGNGGEVILHRLGREIPVIVIAAVAQRTIENLDFI